jgi:hypothetical protein
VLTSLLGFPLAVYEGFASFGVFVGN